MDLHSEWEVEFLHIGNLCLYPDSVVPWFIKNNCLLLQRTQPDKRAGQLSVEYL